MQLQIYINSGKLDADCTDDADFFVCVSQIIRVIRVIPVCFLNHRLKCCG